MLIGVCPVKCLPLQLINFQRNMKVRVNFYKVNTENEPELSGAFGIQSIPSLLFIPMEGQPQMAAGALPEGQLKKIIDENLL